MNKTDLVKAVAEKAGLTNAESKKALEAAIETVKEALAAGDTITVIGFGTLSAPERPARKGFNPLTKQPIDIAAKKVVKFKPSATLL